MVAFRNRSKGTELAGRVHRHPRHVPCTVGSATALYAPFWRPTGIDFPTCHWFEKIDPSHPLGQHAAALTPGVALLTEVDPGVGVAAALSRLWQAGFRGGLFWSLNAGDAYEFRGPPAEAFQRWVDEQGRRPPRPPAGQPSEQDGEPGAGTATRDNG